ncbi:MAG: YebC/PmpR family DNA-binding transcriptional regulator [Ignavibacteriales bacterium]|nr:MAG: YebC/PmpR family DNA-binding transcriptional regulator [Ignavibacteriaceae bacterium]MBW7872001.1 YebC/PmpR family DNA-binding transcriptional regulator [Ignavibacteria bacterium]MCZ2144096.1 YebC/PmpR family DNA-binding transcriptional regulator [Ignavibacteriales bacterium]OQY74451.1 MAG: YebC/PmpR family DNA-binding transcriptional regulator [Ignavibacteriales bacterium UTCHB3]MBV6446103.1 putative transcriptional regulatory protein [Ignavibacteriaceae bacterium]
MGRIFEKRKHTMFARFAKMSVAFNRVRKEIEIAVKAGGPDPKGNSKLRLAIQNAKAVNMPKDRVEAAIKRASSKDTTGYQEIMYEGIGPGGTSIIVLCATDNSTRTVANVRHHFKKGNGTLGNSGSVLFNFEHKAFFKVHKSSVEDFDEFELELIDSGLEEMDHDDEFIYIYAAFEEYGSMQKALEDKGIEVVSGELQYIPTVYREVSGEQVTEMNELVDLLEEDEDVVAVFHNMQEV